MKTILSLGLLSFGIGLSGCASSSANDGALGSSFAKNAAGHTVWTSFETIAMVDPKKGRHVYTKE